MLHNAGGEVKNAGGEVENISTVNSESSGINQ